MRLPFSLSPGPVKPRRHTPPYLPISWTGLMTIRSWGRRSFTAGSLPCFTSSASCGASLKLFGHWAWSVMIVMPSGLPTSPDCDSALWALASSAGSSEIARAVPSARRARNCLRDFMRPPFPGGQAAVRSGASRPIHATQRQGKGRAEVVGMAAPVE